MSVCYGTVYNFVCCFDAMQAVYALYGVDVDFPIIDDRILQTVYPSRLSYPRCLCFVS